MNAPIKKRRTIKKPGFYRTEIANLSVLPQCNVPHPDEGYRVCGWKIPIKDFKATAYARPFEIGIGNNTLSKLGAYEALNRKAVEMGYKNASDALRAMEEALRELRG
jgi:hypothetical protein